MIGFKYLIGVAGLYITLTAGVYAFPIYDYDGVDIVGVSGLEVDGNLWNMTLHDGSYSELTGSGHELLHSRAFTYDAADALYTFYSTNIVAPESFLSCGTSVCIIGVGYLALDDHTYELSVQGLEIWRDTGDEIEFDWFSSYALSEDSNYGSLHYSTWSKQITVPEPSIALLIASGLIAFGVVRRKARA